MMSFLMMCIDDLIIDSHHREIRLNGRSSDVGIDKFAMHLNEIRQYTLSECKNSESNTCWE